MMEAPTNDADGRVLDVSKYCLVRYPDGSCLPFPLDAADVLTRDEIGIRAFGREGLLLVLHRR
jgi:hypothetical protein